ncbi:MAG TPA: glycosyltransferase family 4 protein [Bacteroidales bacterium]|nr:glycosyltransferase family 4 protein [Bacteroidales bacterium]HPF01838.1 glycosyltransferase family 4 protein [Bacteroidales bacterium]HPJ59890.1 glycosyltransferase family 4 protein [Bacteroidales bacterium]HPR11359.1 glycosyltransferase family 4 protein [Bacteroidales bacterium]HRW85732.1 glycosyltransferase family 4 protein [Bacteroidales bacterium]
MRVLMFGWEFPPHISGGLGTASYGLTKGMASLGDIEVIFVVPKAWGDEDQSIVRLIGANKIPVAFKKIYYKGVRQPVEKIEVSSKIVPYTDPEDFWKITRSEISGHRMIIETNNKGMVDFSGRYDNNLLDEIYKYSVVASVIAEENEFDIIHAHDWLAYPAGIAAMEVSGKPLVIHVHATDFDRSGGSVNPEVYRIEKNGMDAASKIITVSNLTRDIVIHKYNIDPCKVETVYNAVEPVRIDDDIMVKKGFDEKVVTFLGRITLQKGPEYFIEAAYKVLKAMDNVRFVMAGSGDMMERMIRRAASLKIVDRFHFTGFLKGKDVFTMLAMSDVYIMPSVSEPFGISPLEAMQSNVPVIISKQSGVAEILTHAVKTDFWDIDAMADAIYGILNYPALASMFIKNGKEEVIRLKWDNSARHVKDIYERVIWHK